jgi:X-Pro dipeptidyl-peptidase
MTTLFLIVMSSVTLVSVSHPSQAQAESTLAQEGITQVKRHRIYIQIESEADKQMDAWFDDAAAIALTRQAADYWEKVTDGKMTSFDVVTSQINHISRELLCSQAFGENSLRFTAANNAFEFDSETINHVITYLPSGCLASNGVTTGLSDNGSDGLHSRGEMRADGSYNPLNIQVSLYGNNGETFDQLRDRDRDVVTHELGHNLGLNHSGVQNCSNLCTDGGSSYVFDQYEDLYSPMSSSFPALNHPALSGFEQDLLGTSRYGTAKDITFDSGSPTQYTEDLDSIGASTGLKYLKVIDPTDAREYFVEFRNGEGQDEETFYATDPNSADYKGIRITTAATCFVDCEGLNFEGVMVPTGYATTPDKFHSIFKQGDVFETQTGSLKITVNTLGSNANVTVSVPTSPTTSLNPSPVKNIQVSDMRYTSFALAWSEDYDGGSPLTAYHVKICVNMCIVDAQVIMDQDLSPLQHYLPVTNLNYGKDYHIQITAKNINGESSIEPRYMYYIVSTPTPPTDDALPEIDAEGQMISNFRRFQPIAKSYYIETSDDTDNDGQSDLIHFSVLTPTASYNESVSGITTHKYPNVVHISPYFAFKNLPSVFSPDYNTVAEIGAEENYARNLPEWHSGVTDEDFAANYSQILNGEAAKYLEYGYNSVEVEVPGTGLSQGCSSAGGPNEVNAGVQVLKWLNGDPSVKVFTDTTRATQITDLTTDTFSTGLSSMIGWSHDGSLPIAIANTGVQGLTSIVPGSAIFSWYDYYRMGGAIRHSSYDDGSSNYGLEAGDPYSGTPALPDAFNSADLDALAAFDSTRQNAQVCYASWDQLSIDEDRYTGDYNDSVWAPRDAGINVAGMNPDLGVLIIHGFNDWNVTMINALKLRDALKANGIHYQMDLGYDGHNQRADKSTINKWFAHYLYGVNNSATQQIARVADPIERNTFHEYPDWPLTDTQQTVDFPLTAPAPPQALNALSYDGLATFNDLSAFRTSSGSWANNLPTALDNGEIVVSVTDPLSSDLYLSGAFQVQAQVGVLNKADADVTAYIYYYPPAAEPWTNHPIPSNPGLGSLGVVHPLTAPRTDLTTPRHQNHLTRHPDTGAAWGQDLTAQDLTSVVPWTGPEPAVAPQDDGPGTPQDYLTPLADTHDDNSEALLISKGTLQMSNRNSLTTPDVVTTNTLYDLNITLEPQDFLASAGGRLAVIIAGADPTMGVKPPTPTQFIVNPTSIKAALPVVGALPDNLTPQQPENVADAALANTGTPMNLLLLIFLIITAAVNTPVILRMAKPLLRTCRQLYRG